MSRTPKELQRLREELRQRREAKTKRLVEERERILSAYYDDPVREYWRSKGNVRFVLHGLEGMVSGWARVIEIVTDPERMRHVDFDEYCHFVSQREYLAEAIDAASKDQLQQYLPEISAVDRRFLTVVDLSDRCIYGATIAAKWGYTREKNWWYFCHPRYPGPDWLHF